DAAQTFGTWIWLGGRIPPEAEWHRLPTPLASPAVRRALYGMEAGFLVLLLAAGWRMSRAGDALGLCATFGLACTVSVMLSPVSWAHSFVVTLPAALFVPFWLWRERRSWLPFASATTLVVLGVQIYLFRTTLKEVAVLGVGMAAWHLWASWQILGIKRPASAGALPSWHE
ncbi:MAG: hypothetical protein V1750_02695, partial [Acidobacteriota bacterium]